MSTQFSFTLPSALQVRHDSGEGLGAQWVVNPPFYLATLQGGQARNSKVKIVSGGRGGVGEQVEEEVVV